MRVCACDRVRLSVFAIVRQSMVECTKDMGHERQCQKIIVDQHFCHVILHNNLIIKHNNIQLIRSGRLLGMIAHMSNGMGTYQFKYLNLFVIFKQFIVSLVLLGFLRLSIFALK